MVLAGDVDLKFEKPDNVVYLKRLNDVIYKHNEKKLSEDRCQRIVLALEQAGSSSEEKHEEHLSQLNEKNAGSPKQGTKYDMS